MHWKNGQFYQDDEFCLSPLDRGFTLGDGIFTTIKCCNGKPLYWADHVERLKTASSFFRLPFDEEAFKAEAYDVLCHLLQQNNQGTGYGVARISLSRGVGIRGLVQPNSSQIQPTTSIITSPFVVNHWLDCHTAFISTVVRNETSPVSRFKTLCYLDNILGLQEATQNGATEVLFLNTKGHLACSSVGNVLLKGHDGQFYTPYSADGAIEGITLKALKSVYTINERSISYEDLHHYSAILTINSLKLATPLDFVTGIGSDKQTITFPQSRGMAYRCNETLQELENSEQ